MWRERDIWVARKRDTQNGDCRKIIVFFYSSDLFSR